MIKNKKPGQFKLIWLSIKYWRKIPYGYDKTLAQMTDEERANRKKYDSVDSMREFSKWYRQRY